MKEYPIIFSTAMVKAILSGTKKQTRRIIKPSPDLIESKLLKCRYGESGDHLWVREKYIRPSVDSPVVLYRADYDADHALRYVKWVSPLFMPRKESRITLRIKKVEAQKLHAMTAADCIQEGINLIDGLSPSAIFRELWDSIKGEGSYNINPWVWAIHFEVIEP